MGRRRLREAGGLSLGHTIGRRQKGRALLPFPRTLVFLNTSTQTACLRALQKVLVSTCPFIFKCQVGKGQADGWAGGREQSREGPGRKLLGRTS